MLTELIINENEHETRVALLEDKTIVELFIERRDESSLTGNIYKAKVQRVLPGMQAAFVDIGLEQAAFIYGGDVIGDIDKELEQIFLKNKESSADKSFDTPPVPSTESFNVIEDVLSEGKEILVQVSKSPIGSKGARLTSHVSLPGHFLVFMPTAQHIGVSRRIEDEMERDRLRKIVSVIRDQETSGYIVRTAAEGVSENKLAFEKDFLNNLWQNLYNKYLTASAPCLIHQELSIVLRAVRDLFIKEADRLVIDSKRGYNAVLGFLDEYMPSLKDSVELYEGAEPIFDAYNLEGDISRALKKKVWLKSGGYIVIEQTEALVAIDVNTGRYVGKHNLEETILKTNLEAVKEIAYQIRLRDLGGIIIIDFIDMTKKSNQEKVYNAFKEALNKDRSRTNVVPISEIGLIQMTRKRIRKPLSNFLCEPCFYCEGEGYLMSPKSICHNIHSEIMRGANDVVGSRLTLRVHPMIAEALHGEENHIVLSLERILNKGIEIYPNNKFHIEEFDIVESLSKSKDLY